MQFNKFILVSLCLGLFPFANAEMFESTGYGDTVESAKKDAVSNAIKFSVGEFLMNQEELVNEEFNQKIISYSNAYVKKIEVRSQEKLGEQFIVNVAVDIESQKLIDALKDKKIAKAKNVIDSDILTDVNNHFDKKSINEKNLKDFSQLVDEFLFKPIRDHKEIVHVDILGKLKPLPENEDEEYLWVSLPIKITIDNNYIKGLKRVIEEMKPRGSKHKDSILLYTQNINKENSSWTSIEVDTQKLDRLYYPYNRNDYLDSNKAQFYVTLFDKNDDKLRELHFSNSDINLLSKEFEYTAKRKNNDSKFSTALSSSLLFYTGNRSVSYAFGSVEGEIVFALSKEEISELKDIHIEYRYHYAGDNYK